MRIKIASGLAGTASLVGSIVVPTVIPDISPFVSYALLGMCGVMYLIAAYLCVTDYMRKQPAFGTRMPLYEALRHIASNSAWASSLQLADLAKAEEALAAELIEAMAGGDVSARGVEVLNPHTGQIAAASEEIPVTFWKHAFIQPFAEIIAANPLRCAAGTQGRFAVTERKQYRQITLHSADVAKRWPGRRRLRLSRRKETVFERAIKAHIHRMEAGPDAE